MEFINKILQGNCKDRMKELPDKSVRCCVTSPPYLGLRDYGTGKWEGGDADCSHFKESKGANANTGQKNDMQGCGDSIYKDVCPKCGATRVDEQIGLDKRSTGFTCYGIGAMELTDVEVTYWRILSFPFDFQQLLDDMDNSIPADERSVATTAKSETNNPTQ